MTVALNEKELYPLLEVMLNEVDGSLPAFWVTSIELSFQGQCAV